MSHSITPLHYTRFTCTHVSYNPLFTSLLVSCNIKHVVVWRASDVYVANPPNAILPYSVLTLSVMSSTSYPDTSPFSRSHCPRAALQAFPFSTTHSHLHFSSFREEAALYCSWLVLFFVSILTAETLGIRNGYRAAACGERGFIRPNVEMELMIGIWCKHTVGKFNTCEAVLQKPCENM